MIRAAVRDAMRDAVRGLGFSRLPSRRGRPIGELLIVPPDLRTADPSFPVEVADGLFGIGGVSLAMIDSSPFELAAPHAGWERELHGFGWLRHFSLDRTPENAALARYLALDWIAIGDAGRLAATAFRPEVTARRVLSWLAHIHTLIA